MIPYLSHWFLLLEMQPKHDMYDSQMICFPHCVAVGKQIRRQSGGEDVELRTLHPTMSSSKLVVGSVF